MDEQETWMRHGLCLRHPRLGWISDADRVGLGETATMAVICDRCPVFSECAAFVARKSISGGFWAGAHRDLDDAATIEGAA